MGASKSTNKFAGLGNTNYGQLSGPSPSFGSAPSLNVAEKVSSPMNNPFSGKATSGNVGFLQGAKANIDYGQMENKKPSWQEGATYLGNRLQDLGGVGGQLGAAQRRAGEINQGYGNFGGRSEQVGDGMYMYTPDRMGPMVIGGGAAPQERSTGQRIAGAAGGALSGAAAGSTFGPVGTAVGGAIGGLGGLFG
jgi:hypothetical protein